MERMPDQQGTNVTYLATELDTTQLVGCCYQVPAGSQEDNVYQALARYFGSGKVEEVSTDEFMSSEDGEYETDCD